MARFVSKIDVSPSWPERLTRIAFVLMLGLVIARAAMPSNLRDPLATAGGAPVPRAVGPAAGLGLDLLCCVPALLVLVRRVSDKTFSLRAVWSCIPLAILSAWMILSPVWAADKFAAAVSAFHWVAAAAALWAAAQLVGTWLRLRLVVAVCFSLVSVFAIEGFIYRFQELPAMRKSFDENKEAALAVPNLTAGSLEAQLFENKLKQGEMMGFFASANTFGAAISLLLVLGVGIVIQQFADRDAVKWAVPTAGVVMAAGMVILALTRSRGAFATLGTALAFFFLIWKTRARLASHARRYFFAGVAVVGFGIAAVVGHGLFHGSLPTRTLTFRWHYWVGASRIFRDHPLLGVGWANFGDNYLAHRLPQAPEEVKDPHNFLVKFFVELGLVGGVLLIAWLLRLWWELTRPVTPPAPSPIATARNVPPAGPGVVKFAAAVGGLAALIYLAIGADWVREQTDTIVLNLIKWLLFTAAIILTAALVGLRSLEVQVADDRPAPWILYGVLLAVAGMLVHNLIDFSLFEVGPMFLFALLAGSALGARQAAAGGPRGSTTPVAIALVAVVVLFVGVALFFWGPVVAAQRAADHADELIWLGKITDGVPEDPMQLARQGEAAVNLLADAAALVPTNADYSLRGAEYAVRTANLLQAARMRDPSLDVVPAISSLIVQARASVERAVRGNPLSAESHRLRAGLLRTGPNPDLTAARQELLEAVSIDPNNVERRIETADLLAATGRPEDRALARQQYEAALRFDSLLPPEEIKRMTSDRAAEVRRKIASLDHPATSPDGR